MLKTIAVLEGNTVINIIVNEDVESAEEALGKKCIEYTSENPAAIGYTWDGAKFIAPAAETIIEGEVVPPAIEG